MELIWLVTKLQPTIYHLDNLDTMNLSTFKQSDSVFNKTIRLSTLNGASPFWGCFENENSKKKKKDEKQKQMKFPFQWNLSWRLASPVWSLAFSG